MTSASLPFSHNPPPLRARSPGPPIAPFDLGTPVEPSPDQLPAWQQHDVGGEALPGYRKSDEMRGGVEDKPREKKAEEQSEKLLMRADKFQYNLGSEGLSRKEKGWKKALKVWWPPAE